MDNKKSRTYTQIGTLANKDITQPSYNEVTRDGY